MTHCGHDFDVPWHLPSKYKEQCVGVLDGLALSFRRCRYIDFDNLQTGQSIKDAIVVVDEATDSGAAYFMVNCTHPDHFAHLLEDRDWAHRIKGVFCNASRKSHAELEASDALDDGNPVEFGEQHKAMRDRSPWINVFGGCCGCDIRHVTEIAHALIP